MRHGRTRKNTDKGELNLSQNVVGVDRGSFPPVLLCCQLEDGKVEMRRVFRSISGCSDVPDDLPFMQFIAFAQPFSVALQVCVVVAVLLCWIELIDGDPARLALEEPRDRAVFD